MSVPESLAADDERDPFLRLPGLFRRFELANIVELGPDYHFEDGGATADGEPLIAVYVRARPAEIQ